MFKCNVPERKHVPSKGIEYLCIKKLKLPTTLITDGNLSFFRNWKWKVNQALNWHCLKFAKCELVTGNRRNLDCFVFMYFLLRWQNTHWTLMAFSAKAVRIHMTIVMCLCDKFFPSRFCVYCFQEILFSAARSYICITWNLCVKLLARCLNC